MVDKIISDKKQAAENKFPGFLKVS